MVDKIKNAINLHMIFGMLGLLLIITGLFQFVSLIKDPLGYILAFLGVSLVVQYIYTLEKKTGVSEAFLWKRFAVIAVLIIIIYNILK